MEMIDVYLSNMFSPYPASQRLLDAKEELRQMMEDAYLEAIGEGATENEAVGRVITQFGNLEELSTVLGISQEVQVPGNAPSPNGEMSPNSPPPLTLAEAIDFSDARRETQSSLGLAVALFVFSPIALLFLTGNTTIQRVIPSENLRVLIGLGVLLTFVAIGVSILLYRQGRLAPFREISEGNFSVSPLITDWAEALRLEHSRKRYLALVTAVPLWILAGIPVLAYAVISDENLEGNEMGLFAWGVPMTLFLVGVGLIVFISANWANAVANLLTQSSSDGGMENAPPAVKALLAAYWPMITAIYLAWSFLGHAWGTSWVIWPIAGVLFGALAAFFGTLGTSRQEESHPERMRE